MQMFDSLSIKTLVLVFVLAFTNTNVLAATAKSVPMATPPVGTAASMTSLNQKEIHNAYNEGDFDKVIELIDGFNKTHKTYSRADSIFISKHLAVVYSANPPTREKGKYYMYRLLEMMPSAELVDMFVSDEIDRIFDKVRKEFVTRQKSFGIDSTQISSPEKPATGSAAAASTQTVSNSPAQSKSGAGATGESKSGLKKNAFWIATGTGVVVAATAAVFIYLSDSPTSGKTITIPSKTTAEN
jgi:hypothetical protein